MSHLAIFALGPLRIELDGQPLQTSRHKALALLVYLAASPMKNTRELLSTFLWPEYEQEKAFAYLRRTVWELNNLLGKGWLEVDREKIDLSPSADIFLDVKKFQALLTTINSHQHPVEAVCLECVANLHKAALLYRGDFLAAFSLRDSANFDDWQFFQQEAMRRTFAGALQKLVSLLIQGRLYTDAISFAQRWLALDTLNEEAHRQLMKAYTWNGQRHTALRQYQECQRVLKMELGIAPEPATTTLYEGIVSGTYEKQYGNDQILLEKKLPDTLEVVTVADWTGRRAIRPEYNLPTPSTKFIGRQPELKQIESQLSDPACWLLTLLGQGGIGKTRLAIEIAQNQINNFTHGVYFIPLSAVKDQQSLAPTIAQAMGLTLGQHGPTPEEQLLDFVREKSLLMILDSFEGLTQWTGLLAQIHSNASEVKMLVTSRHRLHLQGEWVIGINGLDYPPERAQKASGRAGEGLKTYSAVELFLQASHRSCITFQPEPVDMAAIHQITQILEGMPLGLELAATWVNTLSCHEISQEIKRGLDILETTLVDVPDRQRSIRAVFDYSWNLLSDREQVLLPRLAVFRGSFSRQAAEQVVGISLRELSCLVDKSLVQRTPGGRFDLHDQLRQYCAERLNQVPADNHETHRRHCAYFSTRLWEWNQQMSQEQQGQTLRVVEVELANLQASCEWAIRQKRLDYLEQSMDGMCQLYLRRARFAEGQEICTQVVDAIRSSSDPYDHLAQSRLLARMLVWQAVLCLNLEQLDVARELLHESEQILDDPQLEPNQLIQERSFFLVVRTLLANLCFDTESVLNDYRKAFQLSIQATGKSPRLLIYSWRFLMGGAVSKELYSQMEASLSVVQQCGDPFEIGCHLYVLGIIELYHFCRMEKAESLLRDSISKFQAIDDPATQVMIFKALGYLLLVQGKFEECLVLKQRELESVQDIGDRRMMGIARAEIGEVLYHLGRYTEAQDQIRQGIALLQGRSDYEVAFRHRYLGDVLLADGLLAESQAAYELSYQFFHARNEKGWMFTALTGLSRTQLALGDQQGAWIHAVQALRTYADVQLYTFFAYLTVAEIALLLAERGEVTLAFELYNLVLSQGCLAQSRWFADLFGTFIEQTASHLSADEYSKAKKRGEGLFFSDAIAQLIVYINDHNPES